MKKRPPKLIAAVLLLIIGIPFLLFTGWKIQELLIWLEMEEKLEQVHLQTICLAANSVHWHKQGKEILVNGHLFDVKTYQEENDKVVFTGLYDEAETRLKKNMERLLQQEQEKDNAGKEIVKQAASPFLFFAHYKIACSPPSPIIPADIFGDTVSQPLFTFLSVPYPPPKN